MNRKHLEMAVTFVVAVALVAGGQVICADATELLASTDADELESKSATAPQGEAVLQHPDSQENNKPRLTKPDLLETSETKRTESKQAESAKTQEDESPWNSLRHSYERSAKHRKAQTDNESAAKWASLKHSYGFNIPPTGNRDSSHSLQNHNPLDVNDSF